MMFYKTFQDIKFCTPRFLCKYSKKIIGTVFCKLLTELTEKILSGEYTNTFIGDYYFIFFKRTFAPPSRLLHFFSFSAEI